MFDAKHGGRSFVAGIADAAAGGAVDADTMFLSASTSKVITAILLLQLAAAKRLSLDDTLNQTCPKSPYPKEITQRMLLNHSSGIPNPNPMTWVHRLADRGSFDEDKALDTILAHHAQTAFAPGARYGYSNMVYWLLGRVLERVSGKTYAGLVQTGIADRLNLRQEDLSCNPLSGVPLACGHLKRWIVVYPVARWLMPAELRDRPAGALARLLPLNTNGPAYGGIFATSRGYLRVLKDLLSLQPRLLSVPLHDELLKPQHDATGRPLGVTLGVRIGESRGRR